MPSLAPWAGISGHLTWDKQEIEVVQHYPPGELGRGVYISNEALASTGPVDAGASSRASRWRLSPGTGPRLAGHAHNDHGQGLNASADLGLLSATAARDTFAGALERVGPTCDREAIRTI